jgi:NADH-quinone oxidoreductase subunit F
LTDRPLTKNFRQDNKPLTLQEYKKTGGYEALAKVLKSMTPQDVVKVVKASCLRGRGGAGFPTGIKWTGMAEESRRPKYVVVDADEMEPGAFKDRILMEGDPHQLIEGIILAAYATQAEFSIIFVRWEYTKAQERLRHAIGEAYGNNLLGKNILGSGFRHDMHLHVSAGRYICGEGSALLESLEGKRAIPRSRVPRANEVGLWGGPTAMNNVETLCCVPHIVNNGPQWFLDLSRSKDGGTKIYTISGKVKKPGWWELPMGTTVREILEEHAGGMRDGLKFRALLPGGASTNFVIEDNLDVKMDFDSMPTAGSRLGTATIIVLDDKTCPVGMVHNLEKFFAQESCGWCTPCREGLPWTTSILGALEEGKGKPEDLDRLELFTKLLGPGRTFCALAPGAMEPLESALQYFREDFERHIKEERCPWR